MFEESRRTSRPRNVRTVTDPAVLAALAHPTRRRLMDALKTVDAATVGALADQLEVAAGSASHHLKVLAAADLVTEVPELSTDRRERWWRHRRRLSKSTGFTLFWFGGTASVLGNTTSSFLLPLLAVTVARPGDACAPRSPRGGASWRTTRSCATSPGWVGCRTSA